jgi:hypothetical protein
LRGAASVRGVLLRGVRFADRTILCDLDSREIPLAALEQVFRAVEEVFTALGHGGLPAVRLVWGYDRMALHCARRADKSVLGVFATAKTGVTDTVGLQAQLRDFCGVEMAALAAA